MTRFGTGRVAAAGITGAVGDFAARPAIVDIGLAIDAVAADYPGQPAA